MLPLHQCHAQIRFSGATQVAHLADRQNGPTCGFEAIENLIQLFHPAGNDLTETDLIPRARCYGWTQETPEGPSLDPHGYVPILADYQINAFWCPADFAQVIVPALLNNRAIVAIGDAHALDARSYPPNSSHAFLIGNLVLDTSGQFVEGFTGIDSNFQREAFWPFGAVQQALRWTAMQMTPTPVLVTTQAIRWPGQVRSYQRDPMGHCIAVAG